MQDIQEVKQRQQFRTVINGYRLHGELYQNQDQQLIFSLCIQSSSDKTINYHLIFTNQNLHYFKLVQCFQSVKLLYEHLSKMTKTKVKFDFQNNALLIFYQNRKILKQFLINLSSPSKFSEIKRVEEQEQINDGLLKIESISTESLTQHENEIQFQQLVEKNDTVQNQQNKNNDLTQSEMQTKQVDKLQEQLRKCLGYMEEEKTKEQDKFPGFKKHNYQFAKKQHQSLDLYEFFLQFKVQHLVEIVQNEQIDKIPEIILKRAKLIQVPPFNQITLTNLLSLSLQENCIAKIENLDSIPNLEKLNLQANSIKDIENIGNLKNLRSLKLGNNKIQQMKGFQNLLNLQILWIDFNSIKKIQGLTSVNRLKCLNLSFNEISRIEGLDGLKNLQELLLNENQLTQIENLGSLSKLTRLSLNSNFITQIKGLKKLLLIEVIYLTGNSIDTFDRAAFDELNWLKMLKQLRLNGNQIEWAQQSLSLIERLKNYGVKVKI